MRNIIKLRNHPVLNFACEELDAIQAAHDIRSQKKQKKAVEWVIGTWNDCEEQLPLDTDKLGKHWPWKACDELAYDNDSYTIIRNYQQVILTGQSERSTLYAVYQYCKEQWQLEWIYPDQPAAYTSNQQSTVVENGSIVQPEFERRGFVYENLKDKSYLVDVVDWLAKNRQNELFLTFSLWHYLRDELAPELIKRGISLTLGGHSMKFFTEMQYTLGLNSDGSAPAFAGKTQLNYEEDAWQNPVIADIIDYCREVPMLSRLSLWPEDIAISAGSTQENSFLSLYIRFSERLQKALVSEGLDIKVEHIAYNAGLSWDMLELQKGMKTSEDINTLFAYWGRDYSQGWQVNEREEEQRAYQSLQKWIAETQKSNRELAVFEYYSDHYMLSHLFPSMPERIVEDVNFYRSLGITAVTNLVVPYPQADESYSWKWAQGYNSYVFARATWGESISQIREDYWSTFDTHTITLFREIMERTGELLTRVSSYNVPLFPSRVVDVQAASADRTKKEIVCCLSEINRNILMAYPAIGEPEITDVSSVERYLTHIYHSVVELLSRWNEKK